MGYPPLMGRLHTRYSPVRRSPTSYCYDSLPLDLHVLSLSLAFILSQDQTLRCWFVFMSSDQEFRLKCLVFIDGSSSLILVLLVEYVNLSKNFSFFNASVFRKRGAKIESLFLTSNFFESFFKTSSRSGSFAWISPTSTSPIIMSCVAISLDCGCKGRPFLLSLQMFSKLFCNYFSQIYPTRGHTG